MVMMLALLIVVIISVAEGRKYSSAGLSPQLAVAASCSINNNETRRCANLGNISIPSPFVMLDKDGVIEAAACPVPFESADFVLANCSSASQGQVFWQTFTKALPQQEVQHELIGPPALLGIISSSPYIIHVNLTWDSLLMHHHPHLYDNNDAPSACRRPRSSTNLSHYFPTVISMSRLHLHGNTAVTLSSNTIFLLFNCSAIFNEILSLNTGIHLRVIRDSSSCSLYMQTCHMFWGAIPDICYQLAWVDDTEADDQRYRPDLYMTELSLQAILNNMSCTHFEVFVASSNGRSDEIPRVGQWLPGVMQVRLMNSDCALCRSSEGTCVYDASNHTYQGCNCTTYNIADYVSGSGDCQVRIPDIFPCWKLGSVVITCSVFVQGGIVFGGICISCLVCLFCVCCCIYRCGKRKMKNLTLKRRALWERRHALGSNSDSILTELDDLVGLSQRPVEFSYKSIESATSSFNFLVGKGGFGVVFKGVVAASKINFHNQEQLSSSTKEKLSSSVKEIAVKVLDVRSHHSKKQFLNEVAIIGRVHHINVVRLLGFCVQDEHEMLVYEYVSNGSLDKWLFERSIDEKGMVQMLSWRQRYNIATGIARGLSYLHEECRHRIVHCDMKPHNILLDGQMCPKIADFGLARLINRNESRVITFAKGTPGYMAPELWVGGDIQLSTKADVYSFGMLLLELISGRKNFAHAQPPFPALAFHTTNNDGDIESLVDVRLRSSHATGQDDCILQEQLQQQIRIAVMVALWCIQDHPASRPCMSLVVKFLECVALVPEQPPYPTIASANSQNSLCQIQQQGMIGCTDSVSLTASDLTPR